jgi:hypothetical protein
MPTDKGIRLDDRQRIANSREQPIETNEYHSVDAQKESFFGAVRRRTLICCRNVQISASSITRDRIRSTTIQPMSLHRSLIAHDHRPILDRLPSRIRFATGTGGDATNFSFIIPQSGGVTQNDLNEHASKFYHL